MPPGWRQRGADGQRTRESTGALTPARLDIPGSSWQVAGFGAFRRLVIGR